MATGKRIRKKEQKAKKHRQTLTQRQQNFCNYIVDGLPQYEAYIKAGYSERGARSSSTALLANPSIKAEVARIRYLANHARALTRDEMRTIRADIARDPKSSKTEQLMALRDDAKTMGWDAPQVVEIKGSLIDQLRGE